MTLRTFLAAAALPVLLVAPVAVAQDAPRARSEQRGPVSPEVHAERLATRLGLSADQKVRVQAVLAQQQERFRPRLEALRADQSLTAEQRRERGQAMREQQREALAQSLRTILTPEQFTRFEQMQPRRGEQMRQGQDRRMHGRRLERRGEAMQQRGRHIERRGEQIQRGGAGAAERLGLSDAQKQQMQALAQQHRAAVQALAAERLTAEERRTRMQALRQQFQERRQSVLTPAQREQAEQMRPRTNERRGPSGHRSPRG